MSEHTNPANPKPPSVDRLSLLWRRVNEHKIVQWSLAYIAVAYGIQHGVILTSESFGWPNAVARISMLLLALGLPVVMTFAWYHGERASRQFTKAELSILSALLIIGSLLFYAFVQPSAEIAAGARPGVQQASVTAARAAAASPKGAISVAVLPFANVSGDAGQEFFSDGMTDEITAALTKIADLRVVGRTSAFQFKGQNKDLRAIGQTLGATHLIDGSVRRVGNRVRISAQLIRAEDGVNVWGDTYDRELTDVFAIQEDIARAIATSLHMQLGIAPGESLVSERAIDRETYDLYLRGRTAFHLRTNQRNQETLKILEDVVARAPEFAPGWAWLSEARTNLALILGRGGEQSRRGPLMEGAEVAARRAIALAPRYAGGYGALAESAHSRGKWMEATDSVREGLALDPDDSDLLNIYGQLFRSLGYLKESLDATERAHLLEPLIGLFNRFRAEGLASNGMTELGVRAVEGGACNGCSLFLMPAYAQLGRLKEAADMLPRPLPQTSGVFAQPFVQAAAEVLRAAANKSEPPAHLPDFYSELNFIYAYAGQPERMLDWPEKAVKEGYYRQLHYIWWPTPSSVRKTERFKKLVRDAGLVDYWKARGWPDLCRPVGANDFVCD